MEQDIGTVTNKLPRGGKRAGSGRKPHPPEARKVKISIAIKPQTRAVLEALRQDGETLGEVIDHLVQPNS